MCRCVVGYFFAVQNIEFAYGSFYRYPYRNSFGNHLGVAILEAGTVWLLFSFNYSSTVKWCVCFALHSIFLFVSTGRYILGAESCGCFGSVEIPNEVTIAINSLILIVLVLLVKKNSFVFDGSFREAACRIFVIVFALGSVVVMHEMIGQWSETVFPHKVVTADVESFDGSRVGVPVSCAVAISNHGEEDCRIVGLKRSCSCISDMPVLGEVITSGNSRTFVLEVLPKKTGLR